ncbi:ubiquinone biosynthesis protein UbiH, partial [Neisseria meningitidis]
MRLFTYPTPDLIHIKLKVKIRIHPPLHISSTAGFDIIAYLLQIVQTAFKPLQMPSEIIGIRLCKGYFMSLHSDILVVGAGPAGLSF